MKTFVVLICLLGLQVFAQQQEVILEGKQQGQSVPILLFSGAVTSDSVLLEKADEANVWSERIVKALQVSGTIKVTDKMPDTLTATSLVPNAKLEVKKASSGGAVTISLLAGDAVKPYWFQSFSLIDKYFDNALKAVSTIHTQLVGEPGFASARIYYAGSTTTGNRELFSTNLFGLNRSQLTSDGTILISPTVSPDGSKVAYTSFRNGNADVWIQSTSGGPANILVSTPYVDSSPRFAPDGKTVAFATTVDGNCEIYTIESNSTNKNRITFASGIDTSPSWSPAGDRIVFTSDRSGNPQVYTMASDGTDIRRITYEGEYNDSPVWSPRGDRIVYVRRENGVFQIYQCDPAGVTHKRLLYYSEDQKDPAFVPGGFRISFVTVWQGIPGIALLTPETGEVDMIVTNVVAQRPVWGPPTP
ncbi:MAG: hypothetical protein OEM52_10550 [bacterium]|nr:hypothetical protein [bacterium]